ncbi:hypothetical protein CN907_06945 [Bacillus anthracis]|nr:hypothetical protein CN907_06945 [Bacillus anthracis]
MAVSTITGMGELKIEAYEPCPCGSEKKFKFCCYSKAKSSQPKKQDYPISRINHMLTKSWQDTDYKTCMAFDKEKCDKTIKGAHSIQNNRILNRISEDGHVYCFKAEADENGLNTIFKKISKNKASTFFGFCDLHDTELFLPIEQKEYNQEPIQNFLFAFRAHALEFHKKQRGLKNFQNIVKTFPYVVFDPMFVNGYRVAEFDVNDNSNDYSIFNEYFSTGNFAEMRTFYYKLDFEVDFAVSTAFTVQFDLEQNEINDIYFDKTDKRMPSIYLNVYPVEKGTNIILSYHLKDDQKYKKYFDQLEALSTEKLLEHLNYLIIEYTENVFFSPSFVEGLTDKQKESILKSFGSSIFILDKLDLMMKDNYYNFNLFSGKSTV